jgi:hypothetical protein
VPVAAGVAGDAPVLALVARFDMPAKRGGAAGDDGAQDASLLATEILTQTMGMPSNDIRPFQRGALQWRGHGVGGSED